MSNSVNYALPYTSAYVELGYVMLELSTPISILRRIMLEVQ